MARSVRKFKETVEMRSSLFQRLRSHRFFPVSLLAFVAVAAGVLHVWQRVVVIELAKEVATLTQTNRLLVDDVKKVHSDITALSSAQRIERYAVDTLKMAAISPERLITLVKSSEKGIPSDELASILSSIKRVADYLPVVSETNAETSELKPIRFDTLESGR